MTMDKMLKLAQKSFAVFAGLALLMGVLSAPIGEAMANPIPVGNPTCVDTCGVGTINDRGPRGDVLLAPIPCELTTGTCTIPNDSEGKPVKNVTCSGCSGYIDTYDRNMKPKTCGVSCTTNRTAPV
jgi:hypothetical protein